MLAPSHARTVHRLGRLVGDGLADTPDADLIRRFTASRDELAFAALVRRHAPMVFGVCRRTLGNVHDAEDAFQATFLVLARKAHLVRPDGVSRWLYGVAVRVANKARVRRAKRQVVAVELDHIAARPSPPPVDWLPLFDAALARLSLRDRMPILLCDILGRSRAEAATELGIAEGTLSSRLARGRRKLQHKLTRLGIVPTAAVAMVLSAEPVPAGLIDMTLAVPAAAARALAEGVIRTMTLAKFSSFGALGVCLAAALTAGLVRVPGAGADPTPAAKETPKESPPAKETPKPAAKSDAERIQGTWVVEYIQRNGRAEEKFWVGQEVTFDGAQMKFDLFLRQPTTYKLDPGWDQKRIDIEYNKVVDGLKKKITAKPSIYRFEGGNLHIVLGVIGAEERPESFEWMAKGPPFTHLVLRRPAPVPFATKYPVEFERRELEGTWVCTTVQMGAARHENPGTKLIFKGSRVTIGGPGNGAITECTYTVDLNPSPRHLDLTIISSPRNIGKGTTIRGLYAREGGVLKVCFDEIAKGRPASFEDAGGRPVMYFMKEGAEPAPPTGRVRDLLRERVKALEEQLQGQFERVTIGKDPLTTYLEAVRELGEAELDLAGTREAQIEVLAKMVRTLRDAEKNVSELQQAGLQIKQAVAQAKAARLKAEIELERLKGGK